MTPSDAAPPPATAPAAPRAPSALPHAGVPPWRLVLTLTLSGALSAALLVAAFQLTEPAILANKRRALERAIGEVLHAPARYETLYVRDGQVVADPAGGGEVVYVGYDAAGRPVGFAVVGAANGYADEIRLIVGYDPAQRRILGMTVLENKETPGLGDAIAKDAGWYGQFPGKTREIVPAKQGESQGDPAKVDTITGATISTRTVIRIVRDALDRVGPALEAWRPEGGQG